MTKNYRGSAPVARRRGARRGSCTFWFLFGGLIGAFGVGFAWMSHEPTTLGTLSDEATTRPPNNPPQERQFDFFSMLPEEEVVVPTEEDPAPVGLPLPPAEPASTPSVQASTPSSPPAAPKAQASAQPQPSKPTPPAATQTAAANPAPSAGGSYLLQLGSFRTSADAQRLKAQLALKGIQTSIQTVTIDSGQIYHRVRTAGLDKSQAQSLSARLQREGQESIMIRAR
jgi:cell division protein FtsN